MVNIEDFSKLGLKIAKVISAEKVEGSDKLLKLQVSLGNEERQILAGIAKVYQPEQLINTEIVIVTNLETRLLMGLESQGMLLACQEDNGEPVLLRPEHEVSPGSIIK